MADFSIRETFNVDVPEGMTFPGNDTPGLYTPEADSAYLFRKEILSDFLLGLRNRESMYIAGPTGAGKSSLVTETAARLNLQVQEITANGQMELADLIGQHVLQEGSLVFQDGPLTRAMREGHIFLLDEIDYLDPGVVAGLNGLLQGQPLVLAEKGGEVVPRHPDFVFVATGNTAGGGDDTGLYLGTQRQNLAFMDRFFLMEVDYPSRDEEIQLVTQAIPNLPMTYAEKLVDFAVHVRRLFTGEEMDGPQMDFTISSRVLVRWAKYTLFFKGVSKQGKSPMHHAFDRAVGFRADPATRTALHELLQRVTGEGETV